MKIYKYTGKNLKGKVIKGIFRTDTVEELIAHLKEREYFLLSFKEKAPRKRIEIFKSSLSYENISFFSSQLKTTIGAGITILQSLSILNIQCKNKLLRENISIVISEINKGESLFRSLEKCPHKFPCFFCSMIRVGEESGMLEVALSQLSEYYFKEFKLHKKIKAAMSYPILLSIVTFILSIFLLVKFIPSFASIFSSMNSEVPYMTKIILNISYFTRKNGALITLIIPLMILVVKAFMVYSKKTISYAEILMKLPIVGDVYKEGIEMKLSRILFMLISSGINIMKALEISSETINNECIKRRLIEVISHIGKGHSLSDAMHKTGFFSQIMISFVKIGEETGKLELMLEKLSSIYEENLDTDISKLTDRIQPLMILILGGVIGVIILAMILPIFDIANAV